VIFILFLLRKSLYFNPNILYATGYHFMMLCHHC